MISFLDNPNLKLILFGGKGGVGKTTSAAACGIYLAKTRPNSKILILSTDPAHSLSDSVGKNLNSEIKPIDLMNLKNLYGLEINSKKLHENFLEEHRTEIQELSERSTYFDTEKFSDTQAISYSSSFEFMAIIKLIELLKSGEFNSIVLDTAPTGHTIKFLRTAMELIKQFSVMEDLGAKQRFISKRFHGQYKKTKGDIFLERLKEDLKHFHWTLTGHETEFVPVTIAEEMAVYETRRLIDVLQEYGITSKNIIINGLNFFSSSCIFCVSRRKSEEKYLKEIQERFPLHYLIKIPMFDHEIREEKLSEYIDFLTEKTKFGKVPSSIKNNEAELNMPPPSSPPMPDLLKKDLKYIIFCGKGGVGKTTSAAATAAYLANSRPNKRILIFSIDPAHSLSDSFGYKLEESQFLTRTAKETYFFEDKITLIDGFKNLWGLEIDPEKRFIQFKEKYEETVKEAFRGKLESSSVMGLGISTVKTRPFEKRIIRDFASLAPLGIDEFMALSDTIIRARDQYDSVMIDTAPTGHLIELLQRPEMILKWFASTIEEVQNYRGIMQNFDPITVLLNARKETLLVYKYLMDKTKTEFVAVAIAELMGTAETKRLLKDLRSLKASSQNVIINKIIPSSRCTFCSAKREEQQGYLKKLQEKFPEYTFVAAPLFPQEIRGSESLMNFAKYLYGCRNS